ncbi:hypothetical protein J1N35_029322 [Gossypium stocksii]|uniref:Uncharacterized protein n=1 Tax=Gossypium stocksii TaxID=47602 RepID=A0A9D3UXH9_9ROSI|nr:hypothetical protein J1N35_029322 [Gossypium stocksii]
MGFIYEVVDRAKPAIQQDCRYFTDWFCGAIGVSICSEFVEGLLIARRHSKDGDLLLCDLRNPLSQNTAQQDPFDIREEHEPSSSEDLHKFTPEEVEKLEKELTKLLSQKPASDVKKELANLPLDRFLNYPSSLEVDRMISNAVCSDSGDKSDQEDIDRTISVILGRCKDICAEKKRNPSAKNRFLSF